MTDKLSRRDLLQQSAAFGALAAFGAAACGKSKPQPLVCTDTSSLAPADAQTRALLKYVDASTQPGKSCSSCAQFLPAAPNACGACRVVKGPINPGGYCNSYQPKPA